MDDEMSQPETNTAVLVQLAEVKGQLGLMMQVIQQNHDTTQTRIEDFRHSTETRFESMETRLETLEKNERGTALRGASSGALSGAVVSGTVAVIQHLLTR